jgi:hypothetical protein
MHLRTYVVFEADFPDDGTWKPSGDIERPRGFNLASALIEMLKGQGFEVSELYPRDYYGWEFTVSGIVCFVLQGGEPFLLLSANEGGLVRKLFHAKALALTHQDVLEKLNALLHQDERFHDIRWFTREDYEKGKDKDRNTWRSEP